MAICEHGTDLTDSDCMNCENEVDSINEAANKIFDLCLRPHSAGVPDIDDIKKILKSLVKELCDDAF